MKKFVGIILLVVMMMVNYTAIAAYNYPSGAEAIEMLQEWSKIYEYNYTEDGEENDGWFTYLGLLSAHAFKSETGKECTMENWEKYYAYEQFDILEMEIKQVGEIEGNKVYHIIAKANEELANNYKDVKVLVMICD